MAGKRKPIYGVGINDADYVTQKQEKVNGKRKQTWICPYYKKWVSMLVRCYSDAYHSASPTYSGVRCSEEWLLFSNFKRDIQLYESQYNVSISNSQLDKDILIGGCKVYSKDSCVLISQEINNFITDSGKARGDYMLGVTYMKGDSHTKSPYQAKCCNPFGKRLCKVFHTELEAHNQWKIWKNEILEKYVSLGEIKDTRVIESLRNRYK